MIKHLFCMAILTSSISGLAADQNNFHQPALKNLTSEKSLKAWFVEYAPDQSNVFIQLPYHKIKDHRFAFQISSLRQEESFRRGMGNASEENIGNLIPRSEAQLICESFGYSIVQNVETRDVEKVATNMMRDGSIWDDAELRSIKLQKNSKEADELGLRKDLIFNLSCGK